MLYYILLNVLVYLVSLGLKVHISDNVEERNNQVSSAEIAIHTSVSVNQVIQPQQLQPLSFSAGIAHSSCALCVPSV